MKTHFQRPRAIWQLTKSCEVGGVPTGCKPIQRKGSDCQRSEQKERRKKKTQRGKASKGNCELGREGRRETKREEGNARMVFLHCKGIKEEERRKERVS